MNEEISLSDDTEKPTTEELDLKNIISENCDENYDVKDLAISSFETTSPRIYPTIRGRPRGTRGRRRGRGRARGLSRNNFPSYIPISETTDQHSYSPYQFPTYSSDGTLQINSNTDSDNEESGFENLELKDKADVSSIEVAEKIDEADKIHDLQNKNTEIFEFTEEPDMVGKGSGGEKKKLLDMMSAQFNVNEAAQMLQGERGVPGSKRGRRGSRAGRPPKRKNVVINDRHQYSTTRALQSNNPITQALKNVRKEQVEENVASASQSLSNIKNTICDTQDQSVSDKDSGEDSISFTDVDLENNLFGSSKRPTGRLTRKIGTGRGKVEIQINEESPTVDESASVYLRGSRGSKRGRGRSRVITGSSALLVDSPQSESSGDTNALKQRGIKSRNPAYDDYILDEITPKSKRAKSESSAGRRGRKKSMLNRTDQETHVASDFEENSEEGQSGNIVNEIANDDGVSMNEPNGEEMQTSEEISFNASAIKIKKKKKHFKGLKYSFGKKKKKPKYKSHVQGLMDNSQETESLASEDVDGDSFDSSSQDLSHRLLLLPGEPDPYDPAAEFDDSHSEKSIPLSLRQQREAYQHKEKDGGDEDDEEDDEEEYDENQKENATSSLSDEEGAEEAVGDGDWSHYAHDGDDYEDDDGAPDEAIEGEEVADGVEDVSYEEEEGVNEEEEGVNEEEEGVNDEEEGVNEEEEGVNEEEEGVNEEEEGGNDDEDGGNDEEDGGNDEEDGGIEEEEERENYLHEESYEVEEGGDQEEEFMESSQGQQEYEVSDEDQEYDDDHAEDGQEYEDDPEEQYEEGQDHEVNYSEDHEQEEYEEQDESGELEPQQEKPSDPNASGDISDQLDEANKNLEQSEDYDEELEENVEEHEESGEHESIGEDQEEQDGQDIQDECENEAVDTEPQGKELEHGLEEFENGKEDEIQENEETDNHHDYHNVSEQEHEETDQEEEMNSMENKFDDKDQTQSGKEKMKKNEQKIESIVGQDENSIMKKESRSDESVKDEEKQLIMSTDHDDYDYSYEDEESGLTPRNVDDEMEGLSKKRQGQKRSLDEANSKEVIRKSKRLNRIGAPLAIGVTSDENLVEEHFGDSNVADPHLTNVLCKCRVKGNPKADNLPGDIYCQAIDSFDGRMIGCCNLVSNDRYLRVSAKIPYMLLCTIHRQRVRRHNCCPGCGLFCTQGVFSECRWDKLGGRHYYHKLCGLLINGVALCPHCGTDQPSYEVHLELKLSRKPIICLKQHQETKGFTSSARMSATKNLVPEPEPVAPICVDKDAPILDINGKIISPCKLPIPMDKQKLVAAINAIREGKQINIKPAPKGIYWSCKQGDLEKLLHVLANGVHPNARVREYGNQMGLHTAANHNCIEAVHILVCAGASLDLLESQLQTPLMLAIVKHHNDIVQYLVQAGASLNIKTSDCMTCLHLAAKAGNFDACRHILDSGRLTRHAINVQDEGGWTPLVWASENRCINVVKILLDRGANPQICDVEQNTALHWAAFSGSTHICSMVIDRGCSLRSMNAIGDTPLHIAARQNHVEAVVLLLARGASLDIKNAKSQTPLDCAFPESDVLLQLTLNKELRSVACDSRIKSEKILSSDIAAGKETVPIPCVNGEDEEGLPKDYVYIAENCEAINVNIDRTIASLKWCECEDGCNSENCICSQLNFQCWYDPDGKLLVDFNYADPPMIFECNRACSCNKLSCQNRVVQHGMTSHLQLFRTEGKGWGVRALKDIQKGTYVCEYVGEIITDLEADQREDDSYLFDLDNRDNETYCIDARQYGNVARFINHICEPNLTPVKIFIDHQDLIFPRIAFFANRDIEADEELGFDYGEKFWVIKYKYFTCKCGSSRCKYSSEKIHETLENYNRKIKELNLLNEKLGIETNV